ncbi:MAG: hypothetical protein Q4D13_09065 [Erysipelotrichaceae bacterium]|nr:hypothetical protein [Erysipelotrichaceae bacterium]
MKLVNQNDYPDVIYLTNMGKEDKRHDTSILESGCGICAAMMIVEFFYPEISFTMEDAINMAYEAKANISAGTNFFRYGDKLSEKFDLEYTISEKKEDFLDHLNSGNIVLINVGGDREGHIGILSHGGHYIVADGIVDDKIRILDPGLTDTKYLEEGRIGKVEVDGDYIYCDVDIIMEDTENRRPNPFFLFKKK